MQYQMGPESSSVNSLEKSLKHYLRSRIESRMSIGINKNPSRELRLLQKERGARSPASASPKFPLDSLSDLAERFSSMYALIFGENEKLNVPAIAATDLFGGLKSVPIDLYGTLERNNDDKIETFSRLKSLVIKRTADYGFRYEEIDLESAFDRVAEGMASSIEAASTKNMRAVDDDNSRLDYLKPQNQSGLKVTVHTKSSGLELLYSPACFLRYDSRFGGRLSTPVSSYLGPGTYVFGARTANDSFLDPLEHNIPPNYDIHINSI